jgi:hypothetical protein
MRNFLLLLLVVCFNCSILSGQDISNTIWKNTIDDSQLYLLIRNDTSFWGTHSDSIIMKSSEVKILADTIIWVDLPSIEQCSVQDSGIYKYSITQNILDFKLIKDNCTERMETLTTDGWKATSITTSISNQESTHLTIYPNPCAQNELYIQGIPTESIDHLNIYDVSGRNIMQISDQTFGFVDVSNLHKGVYLLIIKTRDGQVFSCNKFVKQ